MKAIEYLQQIGVTDLRPGFMDDPAFRIAEKADPNALDWYARYVEERDYTPEYLQYARDVITKMTTFLYPRLVESGRLGACADMSGAMSRMLEREGVWNYVAKGAMSTYPAPWLHLPPTFFAPITQEEGKYAPHVWVVAPPFRVIDLTLKLQPHPVPGYARALPDYILADSATRGVSEAQDWIDGPVWGDFVALNGCEPTMEDVLHMAGGDALAKATGFGVWEVKERRALFRYITLAIGGVDEPLEGMRNLCLQGDYPAELLHKFREINGGGTGVATSGRGTQLSK